MSSAQSLLTIPRPSPLEPRDVPVAKNTVPTALASMMPRLEPAPESSPKGLPESPLESLSEGLPENPPITPLKFERVREKVSGQVTLRYFTEEEGLADRWLELYHTSLPVVESFVGAPLEGSITLELVGTGRFAANPVAGVVQVANSFQASDKPLLDAAELGYQLGRVLWYRASSDKNYLALNQLQFRSSGFSSPSRFGQRQRSNPFAAQVMDVDKAQRSPEWLLEAALLPLKHVWSNLQLWQDHLKAQLECYLQARETKETKGLQLKKVSEDYTELSIDQPELARALALLRGQSISQRCPDWQRRVSRALSIDFELNGLSALSLVTRTSLSEWEAIFISDIARWQQEWC